MELNEKTLMVECLLRDLRGNWGDDPETRADQALKLSNECNLENHVSSISEYLDSSDGDWDGRWFRESYRVGGYEDMRNLHRLEMTFHDRSEEFRRMATKFLTYPDCLFDDW